jgi:hypothetical protein
MIWFILIYVITIILHGIYVYIDMDKGENLEHYFKNIDGFLFIIIFLIPLFNTFILIMLIFNRLFNKIWNHVKHWQK